MNAMVCVLTKGFLTAGKHFTVYFFNGLDRFFSLVCSRSVIILMKSSKKVVCQHRKHVYWEKSSINGRMHCWLRHLGPWSWGGEVGPSYDISKHNCPRAWANHLAVMRCRKDSYTTQARKERRSTFNIKALLNHNKQINSKNWHLRVMSLKTLEKIKCILNKRDTSFLYLAGQPPHPPKES